MLHREAKKAASADLDLQHAGYSTSALYELSILQHIHHYGSNSNSNNDGNNMGKPLICTPIGVLTLPPHTILPQNLSLTLLAGGTFGKGYLGHVKGENIKGENVDVTGKNKGKIGPGENPLRYGMTTNICMNG